MVRMNRQRMSYDQIQARKKSATKNGKTARFLIGFALRWRGKKRVAHASALGPDDCRIVAEHFVARLKMGVGGAALIVVA